MSEISEPDTLDFEKPDSVVSKGSELYVKGKEPAKQQPDPEKNTEPDTSDQEQEKDPEKEEEKTEEDEKDAEEPDTSEEDQEKQEDRKSTRLNSSHVAISYAVFCLQQK